MVVHGAKKIIILLLWDVVFVTLHTISMDRDVV